MKTAEEAFIKQSEIIKNVPSKNTRRLHLGIIPCDAILYINHIEFSGTNPHVVCRTAAFSEDVKYFLNTDNSWL